VFVAEQSGIIKVFPGLGGTPTVFADLRAEVTVYEDRGLLGLALDPNFPTSPYVYALYTRDAAIGGTAAEVGRRLPDAARADHRRLSRERAARAPHCDGERRDRNAGAPRRLVPAVHEPLDRRPPFRV